ncbi:PAS domain S-box-containing protein [Lysobacter sp. OAE881]
MNDGAPTPVQIDERERALRESELRLQQVLDNTSAAVFAKDRAGRYLFVNHEFERLTGRNADALLGHNDRDIFPPEMAAALRRNDMLVLLEARAMEFEESGVFAGEHRTFLSAKFPLLDIDQVPYAVCGIATDITRRKQVETALTSSALAVSGAYGRDLFVELSRYLSAILDVDVAFIAQIREDEPTMMRILAFVADDKPRENYDYPIANTACDTVVGHGFRMYPAGLGSLFPLDDDFIEMGAESYAGYPLSDAQGRPLGIISIVSRRPLEQPEFIESVMKIFAVRAAAEIERQRAEDVAQRNAEHLRATVNAALDCIIAMDERGMIVKFNPAAEACFGIREKDALGRSLADTIIPERFRERHQFGLKLYLEGGPGPVLKKRLEVTAMRANGAEFPAELAVGVDDSPSGKVFIGYLRDITERTEAEQRRRRLEAQLLQAKKMEALGHLTGGIAHDFNNLLASIMGYVALAHERSDNGEDARLSGYLDQALQSCERARDLIQQMLMFSRGQNGTGAGDRRRQLHRAEPRGAQPDLGPRHRGRTGRAGERVRGSVRPGATRAGAAEPLCERVRCDAGRRSAPTRASRRARGGDAMRRVPAAGGRRVRRTECRRHRAGHRGRGAGAHVRSVLLDETTRKRRRHGPGDGARHRA